MLYKYKDEIWRNQIVNTSANRMRSYHNLMNRDFSSRNKRCEAKARIEVYYEIAHKHLMESWCSMLYHVKAVVRKMCFSLVASLKFPKAMAVVECVHSFSLEFFLTPLQI